MASGSPNSAALVKATPSRPPPRSGLEEYFSPVGKTLLDASDRKRLHAAGKLVGQRLAAVTQQEELLKEMFDRRQSYREEKLMMENRIALLDTMIDQEHTKVRGGDNQLLTLKRAVDVAEDQVDALSKKMPRQMHAPSVDRQVGQQVVRETTCCFMG